MLLVAECVGVEEGSSNVEFRVKNLEVILMKCRYP